jgi:hypothetical protein
MILSITSANTKGTNLAYRTLPQQLDICDEARDLEMKKLSTPLLLIQFHHGGHDGHDAYDGCLHDLDKGHRPCKLFLHDLQSEVQGNQNRQVYWALNQVQTVVPLSELIESSLGGG